MILPGQSYMNPDWSPDGEWIVFSAGGIIQKCKVNGDSLMTMQYEDDQYYFFPDFSPDGKFIIADRLGKNVVGSLVRIPSDFDSLPQVFIPEIRTAGDPEYFWNNNYLIYNKGSENWRFEEIIILNLADSTEKRITSNEKSDRDPSWSPDGQKIVWSQQVRIHIMNSDGSRQRFIAYGVNPSWSVHDEIVFSHANSDYTKEVLYTIKPDGSARTQITN
jgi:Tol biopolymer transport system component